MYHLMFRLKYMTKSELSQFKIFYDKGIFPHYLPTQFLKFSNLFFNASFCNFHFSIILLKVIKTYKSFPHRTILVK